MSDQVDITEAVRVPFLEHYPESCGLPERVVLDPLPFHIGRGAKNDFIIYSRQVSKEHAEVFAKADDLLIRDLNSTNGTFINGKRITVSRVRDGDIVHVAHKEFRFGCATGGGPSDRLSGQTALSKSDLPASLIRGSHLLQEMIAKDAIRILFQPIVDLHTQQVMGYEALGRGDYEHLSSEPIELFHLAERCHLAPELSRLFRAVAIEEACGLPDRMHVFLNMHPTEMQDERYIDVLRELADLPSYSQRFFLEIHEATLEDCDRMRRHRELLGEIGIGLAFDDFGSGSSRLLELVEVPPDYIKLPLAMIRDIDGDQGRQELVKALTDLCAKKNVRVVAEGIERTGEAEVCKRLGCQYGQGFLFGRPEPLPERTIARRHMAAWTSYQAQVQMAR